MWHSMCDGLRTCCNDGGTCCAGKPPEASEKKCGRGKHAVILRPPSPPRAAKAEEADATPHSKCEWPFECSYSCAEPEPETEEPKEDPTHGWGKLIEKDPPELEPYNPAVPCGIGYACGYRSRGKMYMPGGPGQVFPRMPCHPVCHPCGPCNPCGPCGPCGPCSPPTCRPCMPCMPCDGAGVRGRLMAPAAPGVPMSVSAIVALSLLAANHATGACTNPASCPPGLSPGAPPCPAAAAPPCPTMAPDCPADQGPAAGACPAAQPSGCPTAGPAAAPIHVPCAPPGFADDSCPGDQANAAGCLRPTLSEVHVDSDRHVESAMQYFWQCLDRKMGCGKQ